MKILVLGASGLVGTSLLKVLKNKDCDILTPPSGFVDLTDYARVLDYFDLNRPDHVYLCAAKVGGILANKTFPVEFLNTNMRIGLNVVEACHKYDVKKLMNLGSTCIYPKECPQPMKEEHLLSGKLEPSNEAYALAKISILKLCEYYNSEYDREYITAMPTNLYGESDNYHPFTSHVFASVIRKVKEVKDKGDRTIDMWGDGSPTRDFMYAGDLAEALTFLMENYDGSDGFVNVGTGEETSIKGLYQLVMKCMGVEAEIVCDTSKPNGTMKKVTDVSKLKNLGWKSKISLRDGIEKTIKELESRNWEWKEK